MNSSIMISGSYFVPLLRLHAAIVLGVLANEEARDAECGGTRFAEFIIGDAAALATCSHPTLAPALLLAFAAAGRSR